MNFYLNGQFCQKEQWNVVTNYANVSRIAFPKLFFEWKLFWWSMTKWQPYCCFRYCQDESLILMVFLLGPFLGFRKLTLKRQYSNNIAKAHSSKRERSVCIIILLLFNHWFFAANLTRCFRFCWLNLFRCQNWHLLRFFSTTPCAPTSTSKLNVHYWMNFILLQVVQDFEKMFYFIASSLTANHIILPTFQVKHGVVSATKNIEMHSTLAQNASASSSIFL